MKPFYSIAAAYLVFAALGLAVSPARAGSRQAQNTSPPQQGTAKQRYDEEEKNLLAAVQSAESENAKPIDLTKALAKLARFYSSHNRKAELSAVLDRELASADKSWPPDDHDMLETLRRIAFDYTMCNQRDRAEQISLRVLGVDTKSQGLMSQAVSSDLLELGRITMFKTDSPDAENYFMKALAIDQVRKDDAGASEVMRGLSTLAKLQKNSEKSDELLERALQTLKLNPDRNAVYISTILMDRANSAAGRRDFSAAIDFIQQSLEIEQRLYGNNNSILIARLTFLADNYMHRNDLGSAESSLQRALQIADSNEKDTQHLSKVSPLMLLAELYKQEKKYSESEATIRMAMDLRTAARGADDPSLARDVVQLAELYVAEARYAEAEVQFRRAISLAESDQNGIVNHEMPMYLSEYAEFLKKQNRNEESEKILQRVKEIYETRRAAVQNRTPQI